MEIIVIDGIEFVHCPLCCCIQTVEIAAPLEGYCCTDHYEYALENGDLS